MRLVVAPRAREDLVSIALYISQHRPQAAIKFVEKLAKRFQMLATFPDVGTSRDAWSPGLRAFSFRKYVIYFRASGGTVRILRVIHGSRDASVLEFDDEN